MKHPSSDIHPSAVIPDSSTVWAFCVLGMGVSLGENTSVGAGTELGNYTTVGEGTRIGKGCFLPHRSQIGRYVFIGPHVTFTDDKHPDVGKAHYKPQPPQVGDYASIGAAAVILPGITIGSAARIGAGAVVTRDVPAGETWFGVPARRHLAGPVIPSVVVEG